MRTKTYAEKLRDPRWQKRRLHILERDGWRCARCDADDKMLVVHHVWYHREPWEAPDEALITLCEECHDNHPPTPINPLLEADRQLNDEIERAHLAARERWHDEEFWWLSFAWDGLLMKLTPERLSDVVAQMRSGLPIEEA